MRIAAALLVLATACPLLGGEPKVHRGLAYAEPKDERQTPGRGQELPGRGVGPRRRLAGGG